MAREKKGIDLDAPRRVFLKLRDNPTLFNPGSEKFEDYFKIRVIVGEFYETIAHGLLKGKRNTRKNIGEILVNGECEPDLENIKEERFIEVKASKINNYFKLFDHQIKKYRGLLMNEFPYDKPMVDYAFFAYDIRNVQRNCPDYQTLIQRLAERTSFLIILPLGVVEKIAEKSRRYDRGENGCYKPFHYFNMGVAHSFLTDPIGALISNGVDPSSIKFENSQFPSNWKIEDKEIKPFPIVHFSFRDYEKWLASFRESQRTNAKEEQPLKEDLPF